MIAKLAKKREVFYRALDSGLSLNRSVKKAKIASATGDRWKAQRANGHGDVRPYKRPGREPGKFGAEVVGSIRSAGGNPWKPSERLFTSEDGKSLTEDPNLRAEVRERVRKLVLSELDALLA